MAYMARARVAALLTALLRVRCAAEGTLRGLAKQDDVPHRVVPGEQCQFGAPPQTPYYWDEECEMGKLGCWADGVHAQCRFCGEAPYLGIHCPEDAVVPSPRVCNFTNPPVTPVYWEPTCTLGMKGCYADGKHRGCRFCGAENYTDIPCPVKVCSFDNEPITPYYWDDFCQMGMLGCNADGIHVQCRFCAQVPFQSIECPESVRPPYGECWFPASPSEKYYWDETCEWGKLGCWADGIHSKCRFCGGGAYAEIACPAGET